MNASPEVSCWTGYCTGVVLAAEDAGEPLRQEPPKTGTRDADQVGGARYSCSGCGAVLQSTNPRLRGFISLEKLEEWSLLVRDPTKQLVEASEDRVREEEGGVADRDIEHGSEGEEEGVVRGGVSAEEDCSSDVEDYFPDSLEDSDIPPPSHSTVSSLICKRCFSLKHYNDALNITLSRDDYLRHLASLGSKNALIVLMLDVTDLPGCIFPNLSQLLPPESPVLIVANKIDLFPRDVTNRFWSRLRTHICKEVTLGDGQKVVGVRFVSVKRGTGIVELSEELVRKWGSHNDIYLLGCTNVGKSSLFNKLLLQLCGSRPGELNLDSNMLAPKATISKWPGTTLGLLSFPLLSFGKRRRLLEQQRRREEKIAQGIESKCF